MYFSYTVADSLHYETDQDATYTPFLGSIALGGVILVLVDFDRWQIVREGMLKLMTMLAKEGSHELAALAANANTQAEQAAPEINHRRYLTRTEC